MDLCETVYRDAVDETERQGLRLHFLRDYRNSRSRYTLVACMARKSADQALSGRAQARAWAEKELVNARTAAATLETLVREGVLAPAAERERRRALRLLSEAEDHWRRGDFKGSSTRAREAETRMSAIADRVRTRIGRFTDPETTRIWKHWVDETILASRSGRDAAVVVFKESNRVNVYHAGDFVRSYRADMGRNRLGRKTAAGDLATPEGRYRIVEKKGANRSRYHMALLLDYPTEADRKRLAKAKRSGTVSAEAVPGRAIEIHGEGGRGVDWTEGCIALSNTDIEDLFNRVQVGTRVTIVGGDGGSGPLSGLARRLVSKERAGP